MDDSSRQQLGNYHLVRLLGRGNFAEVYLGEHIHLGTPAAIKVLQARLAGQSMEQFRAEARTIANLVHPNIVRVLDFGVERGIPFLVMEYAPNGTLRQRYPNGTVLSPETVVPCVRQIAAALHYAHERKIIHRDVKPENILLGSNQNLLLSDFGIAATAHTTGSLLVQEKAGTPAYMAPEQLQGKPRPASDQYALGILVYEWLTGVRPFEGTLPELYMQHLHTPPPPLRKKNPAISVALQEVVIIALSKEPQRRFASVQAFAKAFEQAALEHGSTGSIVPPAPDHNTAVPTSQGQITHPPLHPLPLPPVSPSLPPSQVSFQTTPPLPSSQASFQTPPTLPPSQIWRGSTGGMSNVPPPSTRLLSRRAIIAGLVALVITGTSVAVLTLGERVKALFGIASPSATPSISPSTIPSISPSATAVSHTPVSTVTSTPGSTPDATSSPTLPRYSAGLDQFTINSTRSLRADTVYVVYAGHSKASGTLQTGTLIGDGNAGTFTLSTYSLKALSFSLAAGDQLTFVYLIVNYGDRDRTNRTQKFLDALTAMVNTSYDVSSHALTDIDTYLQQKEGFTFSGCDATLVAYSTTFSSETLAQKTQNGSYIQTINAQRTDAPFSCQNSNYDVTWTISRG